MRGKVCQMFTKFHIVGITPAYAGKRLQMLVTLLPARDHPRLCGEKNERKPLQNMQEGSPPPMRGKELCLKSLKTDGRITPAYAGKRLSSFYAWCTGGDHPRLCGEKPQTDFLFLRRPGSPPPMRGKGQVGFLRQCQ